MPADTDIYEEVKDVPSQLCQVELKNNDCYDYVKKLSVDSFNFRNSAVKHRNKTIVATFGVILVAFALVLVAVTASIAHAFARISTLSATLEGAQIKNVSLEVMMYQQLVRDLEVRNQQLQDSSNTTAEMVATLENRSSLLDNRVTNLVSSFNTTHLQLNNSITNVASSLVGVIATHPASSCNDLPPSLPTGDYYLLSSTGSAVRQYCPTITTRCGQTGRWRSVASLDMTNSTHQCLDDLTQTFYMNSNKRLCVRSSNSSGCSSVQLPTTTPYRSVCGLVRAYQFGSPDAFQVVQSSYFSIDTPYVDGVSITHGSPRQHIWTFASARNERDRASLAGCPCMGGSNSRPAFVGDDYFCDSGTSTDSGFKLYGDDPLWDGAGCGPTSNCCSFNTPPWFYKELPQNTTDDIELRVCCNQGSSDEDIAIEAVKIYVK